MQQVPLTIYMHAHMYCSAWLMKRFKAEKNKKSKTPGKLRIKLN